MSRRRRAKPPSPSAAREAIAPPAAGPSAAFDANVAENETIDAPIDIDPKRRLTSDLVCEFEQPCRRDSHGRRLNDERHAGDE